MFIETLKQFWIGLSATPQPPITDIERLSELKKSAASLRADYLTKKQEGNVTHDAATLKELSLARKRMEEADVAYYLALQRWENKESRQRSY